MQKVIQNEQKIFKKDPVIEEQTFWKFEEFFEIKKNVFKDISSVSNIFQGQFWVFVSV